ncbi:MAG: type II secretion system protein GspD [Nitrospirae bacterium RBG_13_39_12]|nr:MAG: type II secretion system protein GspD [Nitrospirae bacterium RBG_13_39_12]
MKTFRSFLTAFSITSCLIFFGYCIAIVTATDSLADTKVAENKPEPANKEKDQSKDKKITFNFIDVDISTVVKFISEITSKNFVFDDRVKGNITIIAPTKLSIEEAFSLFTSVLELKGFTVVPSGKIYKIVPVSQARQSSTEIIKDEKPHVGDTYVTRLVQLKAISSVNAVNFLQPIISKDGYISSFGPSNMLMVVDSVTNMDKVLEILDAIDKPGVEEPEIVLLKYANADDVAKIITEAMGISSRTQTPGVRTTRSVGAGGTVSVEEARANVFADVRLNAVVLLADKQEKEAMKRIIALLDVPLPEATSKINVCFLEYADATELSKVLEGLITGDTPQVKAGVQLAKSPFEPGSKIIITPDKATNSLVIVASPSDYLSLLQVIKQLDRRRKQVYVEAMIVEASIDNLRELGTKWRVIAEKDDEPIVIGGFGTIDASSLKDILFGLTGLTGGGMGNFLDVPLTTIGTDGTATTSTLTIPGFAALFSLNDFRGSINVLSTPQILTSDNQEAEIVVGENVPFISKRESDPTRTVSVFSTIERKDVGITLRLTPQITEGDYVKLDIYQEISALKQESETIVISVGPSTTKRSTKTSVVVKDNQTVVIGGLMEERIEENINRVPLLGDIPIIGWLFKNKTYEKKKTNLLVFLSPHIVKEAAQLSIITDNKKLEFAKTQDRYKQSELLVKFKEETPEERISEILSAEGATIISVLKPNGLYKIRLEEGQDVKDAVKVFSEYEEVEYAEPDYIREIK